MVLPDGALSATIQIVPIDDTIPEDREFVSLTLASNGWYKIGSPFSATLYINENDLPTVTIVTVDDNASETGPRNGRFTITRNSTQISLLQVNYQVSGTAKNGTDFQKLNGTLTIPGGSASQDLLVIPKDDTGYQGDRIVIVTLSKNDDFYTVGDPKDGMVVIHDNDLPTVTISTTVANSFESGTDPGVLTVSRTGNTALPLTVHYGTAGTADPGVDYNALSGTVTIPADSNDNGHSGSQYR